MKRKRSSLLEGMEYSSNCCNSLIGYAATVRILGELYTPEQSGSKDTLSPVLFDADNGYIHEIESLFLKRNEYVSTPCYYISKDRDVLFLCCKNFIIRRKNFSTDILAGVYKSPRMEKVILISNMISSDNDTKKVIMSILESDSNYERILLNEIIPGFMIRRSMGSSMYPSIIEESIINRMPENSIDKSLLHAQNMELFTGLRDFTKSISSNMKNFMNVNINTYSNLELSQSDT